MIRGRKNMIVFTICSKNFFGYALSLHTSLRAEHGPITFYVALCDDAADFDTAQFPFEIIHLGQLGISKLRDHARPLQHH